MGSTHEDPDRSEGGKGCPVEGGTCQQERASRFVSLECRSASSYPVAVLARSRTDTARAYVEYLRSPAARVIFEGQGFTRFNR